MKKSIYKITNLLNNKIYIGQSINPKTRFQRHCVNFGAEKGTSHLEESLINKAILKYGKKNFNLTILEEDIENYNEREKYWIKYYNSLVPNGYNLTEGGEEPPAYYGEKNKNCSHTEQEIEEIKNLLKNTDMSFVEIAKKFNYSNHSTIGFINEGMIWKKENEKYPIRKRKKNNILSSEIVSKIQEDLINKKDTQQFLADKYSVKRHIITDINLGHSYKNPSLSYPLRAKTKNHKKNLTQEEVDNIILLIKTTNFTFTEIGKKFNASTATISNINKGKSYRQKNENYPLR